MSSQLDLTTRKAITFVRPVCVLPNLRRLFRYSVLQMFLTEDFIHASQHAETRLAFSAGRTGVVTLSQANIYRLGSWTATLII